MRVRKNYEDNKRGVYKGRNRWGHKGRKYTTNFKMREYERSEILGDIQKEIRKKEIKDRKSELGPRALFLQRIQETGDFTEAKNHLKNKGLNPEAYGDEVLKQWIEEGR